MFAKEWFYQTTPIPLSVLSGKRYDLTLSFDIQIDLLWLKFPHFPNVEI